MSNDQSEKEYVSGSVKILRDHINDLSVKSLGDNWIHERKVSLETLMLDDFDPCKKMKHAPKISVWDDF